MNTQPKALRMADYLESDPDPIDNEVGAELRRLHEENQALRQALAQPKREYMDVVVAEHADGTYTIQRIPLSKREWVGLTDEEISNCFDYPVISFGLPISFAKSIEAKLKEKNT